MDKRSSLRALLTLTLAIVVLSLLGLGWFAEAKFQERRVGFLYARGTVGLGVGTVEEDSPAKRAGLQAGDEIVAIDGQPVRSEEDFEVHAVDFRRGEAHIFQVLRDGFRKQLVVRPGMDFPWISRFMTSLVSLAYLGIALLAMVQGGRRLPRYLLFGFCAMVAYEMAVPPAYGLPSYVYSVSIAVLQLLSGLQIAVELHLAAIVPGRHPWLRNRPWLVPAAYSVGAVISLVLTWAWIAYLNGLWTPISTETADRIYFNWVMPLWAGVLVAVWAVQALRYSESQGRHQAGLVLAGVLPWAVLIWAWTLVEAVGLTVPWWIETAQNFALLCFPLAIFIAIFRFHLLDIELMVRRSLFYAVLTSLLVVGAYFVLGAGGTLLEYLGVSVQTSVWLTGAACLVLGLCFSPVLDKIRRFIDRCFFPERVALRKRLTELVAELPRQGRVPRMASHLVERLSEIFHLGSATLLLADPKSSLLITAASTHPQFQNEFEETFLLSLQDAGVQHLLQHRRPLAADQVADDSVGLCQRMMVFDAKILVPLTSGERLVGLLLLSGKKRGDRYVAEELELLALVAHNAGVAFENVRLYESATMEGLTGLLRREAVLEHLEQELQRARRYQRPLTIALADLDFFKDVNDRHGHLAGDALLKRVSQGLSAELRSTDFLGRYGGEEFLLIMPETGLRQAAWVAEKLRRRVLGLSVGLEDGSRLSVTISFGLASIDDTSVPENPTTRDLIARADMYLYQAKRGGRNCVEPAIDVESISGEFKTLTAEGA